MTELNLASGASYFRSPEAAITAAIAALQAGKTYYGPSEGSTDLRKALAYRYQEDGISVSSDQVLITPGTKQALYNLFTTLLRENDEVAIPTPAWFGFNELLKYSKGKLVTIPTTLENDYNLDADSIRAKLTPQTRILLLTNPANPTGRLYNRQELESIIALLHDHPNLYLICDEIYDLDTYGKPFTSALACKGPQERIIIVNGFSKNFAMSGWRIGYMIGPEEIIRQCTDFQASTFSGVSMFIQEAALATITGKNDALNPMLHILKEHRQLMQHGLESIPFVRFYLPDGAYYFFPYLGHYLGTETHKGKLIKSTEDLCTYLREDFNLIVANGDNFGGIGHARMSFAVEKHVLQEALERLQKALKQLKHLHRVTA